MGLQTQVQRVDTSVILVFRVLPYIMHLLATVGAVLTLPPWHFPPRNGIPILLKLDPEFCLVRQCKVRGIQFQIPHSEEIKSAKAKAG